MADVRALLAAEKRSRRIVHPHLTYSKTGALTCNVCQLNIISEQLWPGHLKSANHRKNALKSQEITVKPLKRKLDDVEEEESGQDRDYEVDNRKKPRAITETVSEQDSIKQNGVLHAAEHKEVPSVTAESTSQTKPSSPKQVESIPTSEQNVETINEDEWAAFERDMKPLKQADYSAATITAAPISASEMAAQEEKVKKESREQEAEDEKEDENRRMEEEFDVMEEMEERMRRLREKREALRRPSVVEVDTGQVQDPEGVTIDDDETTKDQAATVAVADEEDSDSETDDWYA